MKRFLISAIVSMTCFMAQAHEIIIPVVNIAPGGEKSVNVTLPTIPDGANFTAFQFDIKGLPAGVSLKDAAMNGSPTTRVVKFGSVTVNNATNYRVLSYDTQNTSLTENDVLTLTLAADANAAVGENEADVETALVVTPAGVTADANNDFAINVKGKLDVEIKSSLRTTLVSGFDLDFSSVEGLNAYIVTGYDKSTSEIWMTRVTEAPAGTPVLLKGTSAKQYEIPTTTSHTYLPENFLKGYADADIPLDKSGKYNNLTLKSGKFVAIDEEEVDFPAGKCYLQVPTTIPSATGTALSLNMKNGKKAYIGKYDLDFTGLDTEGLKAYTVTGYKNGTIMMSSVKKVSKGTPLYIIGTANKAYTVPSVAAQAVYANMLCGDADNDIALTMTKDGFTNFVMKGGQFSPLPEDDPEFPAGTAYLPVPTSYLAAATSRGDFEKFQFTEMESEVISMKLGSLDGEDGTTGIRELMNGVESDVWYNLKGQRIDTPTKKGLYILNGKKVVVK